MAPGLLAQVLGSRPALRHAEETGVSEFTARRILLDPLPSLGAASLDIEQIVGNLKSLAEAAAVVIQTLQQLQVGSGRPFSQNRPSPEPQAGPKQCSGLASMEVLESPQGVAKWESGRVREPFVS